MNFRTELSFNSHLVTLNYSDKIFTIGSCFATEIAEKLSTYKFSTLHNPFGTLFHPLAIENALMRIYSNEEYHPSEIYKYGELFLSWDHHSSFNEVTLEKTLTKINSNIHKANGFLQNASLVVITLGTSFIYKLTQYDVIVANCHKIPNSQFTKMLLAEHQIKTSLKNIVEMLSDIGKKDLKILFTLSPVRHIKDGFIENNLSKARLLCTIHTMVENYENCEYFPSYEYMMDDLRDYRFYKEDMLHPNKTAVNYIWNSFKENYISEEVYETMQKVEKINLSLQHKSRNMHTIAHKKFLYSLVKDIQELESLLPKDTFINELLELKKRIQET